MTDTDHLFAGSIPALYDRYLGPLLFEPYAQDLAERVARLAPGALLEIAAGTGIATRALAGSLAQKVNIVATDLNQPMIDFAAQRSDRRISWRQADALQLPFEDETFDLVVCQFGFMFVPDKQAAYREAARVLKPSGHLLFSVWDRIEENEVAKIVSDAVAALFPQDPPSFLARAPYGYYDVSRIRDELNSAGFRTARAEGVECRSRAGSHRDAAVGFCHGSPLHNEIEARDPSGLSAATDAAAAAIAARFGDGPIDARMHAHVIEAAK